MVTSIATAGPTSHFASAAATAAIAITGATGMAAAAMTSVEHRKERDPLSRSFPRFGLMRGVDASLAAEDKIVDIVHRLTCRVVHGLTDEHSTEPLAAGLLASLSPALRLGSKPELLMCVVTYRCIASCKVIEMRSGSVSIVSSLRAS